MSGISKTKYTSQYIDNLSFDETYKEATILPVVEDGGVLVRQPKIATEETLQAVNAKIPTSPSTANDYYPSGTGTNGSVTLTSASTAYAVPATASTKNHSLIIYNGADTDMYVGYQNTNANGILLPSGGVMNFDLGANQCVYAYCGSAGKVITFSYKEIN